MTMGGRLAQLTARKALSAAGRDSSQPLTAAPSVTNEVWFGDGIVLRVGGTARRLLREAEIASIIPDSVGYPEILYAGTAGGVEVMILERIDAQPLAHAWPDLDEAQRRRATRQLAARIRELHAVDPGDIADRPSPQLVGPDPADTANTIRTKLDEARVLGFDKRLIDDAVIFVDRVAPLLTNPAPMGLVHGDLTFENVLWDGTDVVAVLDLEYAARRPIDLELEALFRLCGYPDLHVDDAHASRTRPEDFRAVPLWFRDEYDAPFRVPGVVHRLNAYAIGVCAWELGMCQPIANPPLGHPVDRLKKLLSGDGYIDRYLA